MIARLMQVAIFTGLVATPASGLLAQSNPWYIPQQPQVQAQPTAPYGQVMPQHVPQAYTHAPQYGFGAGYGVQQPHTPVTIVVPQTSAQPQQAAPAYGHAPQPATIGTVGSLPPSISAPAYATTNPGGFVTYQASPTPLAPQYVPQTFSGQQQPPTVYVVPQQQAVPQQVYGYQPQGQVLGSYPPLGGDPTVPAQQPAQQRASPSIAAPSTPPGLASTPSTAAPGAMLLPGFGGPTTLTPGYGGYPGLSPTYPAPYGGTPYLGLPFF